MWQDYLDKAESLINSGYPVDLKHAEEQLNF